MISNSEPAGLRAAIARVLELFALSSSTHPPFPETEMFSEGWMLRLLMDAHINSEGGLPVPMTQGSRWYSEARLSSPFQRSSRQDYLAETETHADGVLGHFAMRGDTRAGIHLTQGGQFVVIEAKMGSKLSAGTKYAPSYDQAVRNVGAMAWTIHTSGLDPSDLDSVAFLVMAPQVQLDREPTFAMCMDRQGMRLKFDQRVEMYRDVDPARYRELRLFQESVFEPTIDLVDILLLSWEDAVVNVEPWTQNILSQFYRECLHHNHVPA